MILRNRKRYILLEIVREKFGRQMWVGHEKAMRARASLSFFSFFHICILFGAIFFESTGGDKKDLNRVARGGYFFYFRMASVCVCM